MQTVPGDHGVSHVNVSLSSLSSCDCRLQGESPRALITAPTRELAVQIHARQGRWRK
ncbi:hypothetical protein ACNKHL_23090 [Shigella flexneri]